LGDPASKRDKKACGDIKEMELKSGETIKVDLGSGVSRLGDSVNYSVNRVKSVKTVLFAGEWLFLTINIDGTRQGLDPIDDPAQSARCVISPSSRKVQRKRWRIR
jgi:hypothetical protein